LAGKLSKFKIAKDLPFRRAMASGFKTSEQTAEAAVQHFEICLIVEANLPAFDII